MRELLPAGVEELDSGHELVTGGLAAARGQILELVAGAGAVISDATVPVDAELLDAAGPALKLVANFAVGYDNIDLYACRKRGVMVTNTPDVLTNATAELAAGLTVAAARQIPAAERRLRGGEWHGWDPGDFLGRELSGCTLGLLGMGRIGLRYAELMSPFAAEIFYVSRSSKPEAESRTGARRKELGELLTVADVISLHLPANPDTYHIIDASALEAMKATAVLINTGRGGLVDGDALAVALEHGKVAAAGLDVYENEPDVSPRLLEAPRVVLTPHIGSATFRARDEMARLVARNVNSVLAGTGPLTQVR